MGYRSHNTGQLLKLGKGQRGIIKLLSVLFICFKVNNKVCEKESPQHSTPGSHCQPIRVEIMDQTSLLSSGLEGSDPGKEAVPGAALAG